LAKKREKRERVSMISTRTTQAKAHLEGMPYQVKLILVIVVVDLGRGGFFQVFFAAAVHDDGNVGLHLLSGVGIIHFIIAVHVAQFA